MNKPSSFALSGGRGFSLVELMVTLSILAILLGIAVPGMVGLIRDSRLATHADILVSSLNTARLEAIRQRKAFEVCPSTTPNSGSTCSTAAADWNSGWIIKDSTTDVVQRIQAKTGITVSTAATAVTFRSTLGSATALTLFTLCAPGRLQQQVDISLSGHVSKKVNSNTLCP